MEFPSVSGKGLTAVQNLKILLWPVYALAWHGITKNFYNVACLQRSTLETKTFIVNSTQPDVIIMTDNPLLFGT